MKFSEIEACRLCKSSDLELFLDLGEQPYSGIFPNKEDKDLPIGQLKLLQCRQGCGLIQMASNFDLDEMYGENYGYRSGLNSSMVEHLKKRAVYAVKIADLKPNDLVVDIGANDGTSLGFFNENYNTLGFDPSAEKFKSYIPDGVDIVFDFFSEDLFKKVSVKSKAKLITSYSMFYDLPDPLGFAKAVYNCLDEDGIWITEQSYILNMVDANSYDTICHEHLEYYGLEQILYLSTKVGFDIIDLDFNDINGGSFVVTFKKSDASFVCSKFLKYLKLEQDRNIKTKEFATQFFNRIKKSRKELISFLENCKNKNKTVGILGASTKGNVILNYCNISAHDIPFVGEVNMDKIGKFTPGSKIPIITEEDILSKNLDYYLILPWHLKSFFISNKKFNNKNLVFPLPNIEII